jgi:hypothetical protein
VEGGTEYHKQHGEPVRHERERERERERVLRRDHSGEERVLCVTFHEEDPEFEGNHMDATGTLRVNKLFK